MQLDLLDARLTYKGTREFTYNISALLQDEDLDFDSGVEIGVLANVVHLGPGRLFSDDESCVREPSTKKT